MSEKIKAPDGVNIITIDDDGETTTTLMHVSNKQVSDGEKGKIKMFLWAGELSTNDNLKHLHPSLVQQIVDQTWPVAYEQGRADAWRWRKYPEEKPNVDETVFVYSVFNHDCSVGWFNKLIEGPECFINESGQIPEVSHWLPIKLPTEAK